ncbi:hypothetical protein IT408_00410 [Candidatus Uhrbacteria bacterium]|nr:hypothetical protein [Candidatus Uhrbacteria bacterium]
MPNIQNRPIELNTFGTVLNPTELGRQSIRETESAKISKKRPKTPSGIVEKGEAELIGARLVRLFLADYNMKSPETTETLQRLVDQVKEDYLRHNTHAELDIITSSAFLEKTTAFIRKNIQTLIGLRNHTFSPIHIYLNFQKAFDYSVQRAILERDESEHT